jgi:hypothetical protein
MKTEEAISIIEEVRAWKEENAAEHDFDIDRIIASARGREAHSKEEVINTTHNKGESGPDD